MMRWLFKKIGESSIFSRKTPKFWHESSAIAQLLVPLTVLYFLIKRIFDRKIQAKKFPTKIICVGNVIAGGAGKTPAAQAIYKRLRSLKPNAKIAFITTGFKAKIYGPVKVDIKIHTAKDVGDESFILAHTGDTIICKDRLKAVELAVSEGFEYLVLDDGMHDKRIFKDITFLVIDGKYGFGNNFVMPSGPLRDRLDFAAAGTDQIILIGEDERNALKILKYATKKELPVLKSFIDVASKIDEKQVYVAFAGIGRPQKFFDMLKNDMKLVLAQTMEFADHHVYNDNDIEALEALAKAEKAKLITTRKDAVKLPKDFLEKIDVVDISLEFEDKEIDKILSKL